jgi:hypothetical protein
MPRLKLKNVFGLISDTNEADAKDGTEYTTGEGATYTGAGIPRPNPRFKKTSVSAFDIEGIKSKDKRKKIINFFIVILT